VLCSVPPGDEPGMFLCVRHMPEETRSPMSVAHKSPSVLISASIAYDNIMAFPGSFGDHILPEKTHILSVSFLVESLRRQRGGVGGNVAYNLALLGERSMLVGAVGRDFGPYRETFEALGVDLGLIVESDAGLTSSAFMMTDRRDNQIAAFYPGASSESAAIDIAAAAARVRYGLVGATAPDAMRDHARAIAAAGARLVYDPSQQVVALSGEDIAAGVDDAWMVVGNDYEYAMIEQKTGLTIDELARRLPLVVVTFGGEGSEIRAGGERTRIPVATARQVEDPTGAGDAYRAGLLKGLLLGCDPWLAGRIAALAATYAVEQHGTQEHTYSADDFVARFDASFPDVRGSLTTEMLRA